MLKRQIIYLFTQSSTLIVHLQWDLCVCVCVCVCVKWSHICVIYVPKAHFPSSSSFVVFLRELNTWDKSQLFFLFNPYKWLVNLTHTHTHTHHIIFSYCVTEESKCVTGVSRHLIHFHTETPRQHREHILSSVPWRRDRLHRTNSQHRYVVIFMMHNFNVVQSTNVFFAHCAVTLETYLSFMPCSILMAFTLIVLLCCIITYLQYKSLL